MKKIFFVLTMLLFSGLLFAENSIKDYIAEFLSKGSCIVLDSGSYADFFPKHTIIKLEYYDGDSLEFTHVDEEIGYDTEDIDLEDCIINIDKNSNIIISEKQK